MSCHNCHKTLWNIFRQSWKIIVTNATRFFFQASQNLLPQLPQAQLFSLWQLWQDMLRSLKFFWSEMKSYITPSFSFLVHAQVGLQCWKTNVATYVIYLHRGAWRLKILLTTPLVCLAMNAGPIGNVITVTFVSGVILIFINDLFLALKLKCC